MGFRCFFLRDQILLSVMLHAALRSATMTYKMGKIWSSATVDTQGRERDGSSPPQAVERRHFPD